MACWSLEGLCSWVCSYSHDLRYHPIEAFGRGSRANGFRTGGVSPLPIGSLTELLGLCSMWKLQVNNDTILYYHCQGMLNVTIERQFMRL